MPLPFSKEEIFELIKKVLNKFGRFGRKFRIDRFLLHYIAGGKDPYNTAVSFAYVNTALSSLAPICAERFTVKDCDVWTDCNFTLEKNIIDFGLALTIRIGAVFSLAFGLLFSALGILIKNKLRLRKEKRQQLKSAAASNNNELNPENIQPEERKDSNG